MKKLANLVLTILKHLTKNTLLHYIHTVYVARISVNITYYIAKCFFKFEMYTKFNQDKCTFNIKWSIVDILLTVDWPRWKHQNDIL